MILLSDILQVLAMLVLSAGLAGAAVFLARMWKLDRLWGRRTPSLEETVAGLASLADHAKEAGILAVEHRAHQLGLPGLERGIEMLARGTSVHELKSRLLEELDESALRTPVFPGLLCSLAIIGLGISGGAAWWIASVGHAGVAPLALAGAALPASIALVLGWRFLGQSSDLIASRLMQGMLVIEALGLIAARRDGRAVRDQLALILPAPAPLRAAAA